ncbi:MAG: lipoyl(octanoyl) transferase LipB [Verrucomicrobiota bacterium]
MGGFNIETHWLGRITYEKALTKQETLVEKVFHGEICDQLLLLEHDPVITIGRTRDQSSLTDRPTSLPVIETNRGGQATYHGPGQLVGYPILNLHHYGKDLHRYLRAIEEGILLIARSQGITARRRESLTGVWVEDRKLASIGIGVRRWVSMHGFALNVCGTLDGFQAIIPCGIEGVEMTSLEREGTGCGLSVSDVASGAAEIIPQVLRTLAEQTPNA